MLKGRAPPGGAAVLASKVSEEVILGSSMEQTRIMSVMLFRSGRGETSCHVQSQQGTEKCIQQV